MASFVNLVRSVRSRINQHQLVHCHRRIARRSPLGPIVTFTFDDFPRAAYHRGGSILQSHGARGTYYVSLGFMNLRTRCGELFVLDDLRRLLDDGHELGCHTYDHLECSRTACREYERNVLKNGAEAARLLNGYRFRHFAYPCGIEAGWHKRMLARQFQTLRTVESGANAGKFDLNRLRANRLYTGSTSVEDVLQLIEANVRSPGWLMFYTHDVCSPPSPFGCTPEYFETVVAAAARSGSSILTVGEASGQLF
jgi:peptidoglycan/xylan/chitin deacetylase (PgdA/CDA1 family)